MKLSKEDSALFFRLYWSLLYYVNQKYPVIKGLKKPDLRDWNINKILELEETFYSHLELIDSFIIENPFEFDQEELEIVNSWKKAVKDRFIIISHQKDHTIFLHNAKIPKAYGVLGLYDEIKDITPKPPIIAGTILLPFKRKIIHSGIIRVDSEPELMPLLRDTIRKNFQQARKRFGIILSLDKPIYLDENLADLIDSELDMNWNQIESNLPEIPTKLLMEIMVSLELYVNKKVVMEIIKRDDAVFWLRKIIQDGRFWYHKSYGDGWAPIHAIHILPIIKSKDALELMMDTIRYRGDDLGVWLIENVPGLLAAFGEDALEDLKCFSSDETLDPFVRTTATTALAFLASKNPSYKDNIKEHLMELFNSTDEPTFASLVADDIASFHDPSVIPQIRMAFEEKRIDELFKTEEELESIIAGERDDSVFSGFEEDPLNHFSRENIEYLHRINQPDHEEEDNKWSDEEEYFDFETDEKSIKKKIGRNDPCPCGSGKKYKKCCMYKEK
ncbi:MAG: DUF1186 domain-containing protein [Methanosarcinaceae archaeon]|nr:DUF1186 domain-containing protein [Methanosarcinaceae archaeon]